jgi:hypothetical protein
MTTELPRGIRNNNPGNIDRDGTEWLGMSQDQTDPRFVVFNSPEYGIRAIAKTLITYQSYNFRTIEAMINRWAPPAENNTAAYINLVTERMGIPSNVPFDILDYAKARPMVEAIIAQENANYVYPAYTVQLGLRLAGIMAPDVGVS